MPPKFKRGEHVLCVGCELWLAAPTNEKVDCLKCANCRDLIWPASNTKFKKNEHVQCPKCDAWMAAPTFEEVDGLNCVKCRGRIWPHGGGPRRKQKMCEDCGLKCASYGLTREGKRRWCARCSSKV